MASINDPSWAKADATPFAACNQAFFNSLLALGRQTHLGFITEIGSGLVVCLTAFWVTIAARTIHGAWHRYLFVSPCLMSGAIPSDFEADDG